MGRHQRIVAAIAAVAAMVTTACAAPQHILILTRVGMSNTGIKGELLRRTSDKPEHEYALIDDSGAREIQDDCAPGTVFRFKPKEWGYDEPDDDWRDCSKKPMIFRLSEAEYTMALAPATNGAGGLVGQYPALSGLVADLQPALDKRDYGQVAFISAQISQHLRGAGSDSQAKAFDLLTTDATGRAVQNRSGLQSLILDRRTNEYVLRPERVEQLERFQLNNNLNGTGKIDMVTLQALRKSKN